ncbi:uncharacterized protein LOC122465956 [Chelonia mydas]|uniref:uncharacterized protein LOC122465956 n=1 Tax=Chelonia mydas TaxID=8469 RepID=UPI001CA81C83|nr:uncharacterized protein LOC122465956 [Chelonia mydas]
MRKKNPFHPCTKCRRCHATAAQLPRHTSASVAAVRVVAPENHWVSNYLCFIPPPQLYKGNPLARDSRYVAAIKQATSVELLDDMLLGDPPRCSALSLFSWSLVAGLVDSGQTKEDLKKSARRIFLERRQHQTESTEGVVHHLHSRILDLWEELREYEETFRTEVDGCIRYIDALPSEDIQGLVNPQEIPNAMEKYLFTKFWERWQHGRRKPANIPYKELTKPEEVINSVVRLLSNPPLHSPPGDANAWCHFWYLNYQYEC